MLLAGVAARAQRHNRPLHLVLFAGAILLVSVIALLVSLRSHSAARAQLADQELLATNTLKAAAKLKALQDVAGRDIGPRLNEPATQVFSRIEQAGVDAGLKSKVPLPPRPRVERPAGKQSVHTKFDYEVRDESLAALMDWMNRAVAAVEGLEVYSVSIKPEAQAWNLRVTFSRWEREQ